MNKSLRLEMKQNLRRPPRVYVKSTDLKTIYGSFHADNIGTFTEWDQLTQEQTIELKQFMQNLSAVYKCFSPEPGDALTDFRFRLPINVISAINKLSIICLDEGFELDIFDSIITNIAQQLRISTTKLSNENKIKALSILESINLAEYKKQSFDSQIKAIFTQLSSIHNKSEKLHAKAISLFNKDKSYSPRAIEGMSLGETVPAKWLIACAIDIIIDEEGFDCLTMLSEDDINILWKKPLLKEGYTDDYFEKKTVNS